MQVVLHSAALDWLSFCRLFVSFFLDGSRRRVRALGGKISGFCLFLGIAIVFAHYAGNLIV